MKKWVVLILLGTVCLAFTSVFHQSGGQRAVDSRREEPVPIPASPQRSGNPVRGFTYLTTGDYLKSGIPYNYFLLGFGKSTVNYLKREGQNANISHEYTAVNAPNGEVVVAPNIHD